jgi:hypothetical protein
MGEKGDNREEMENGKWKMKLIFTAKAQRKRKKALTKKSFWALLAAWR